MSFFGSDFTDAKDNVAAALRRLGLDKAQAAPDLEEDAVALWEVTRGSVVIEISVLKPAENPDAIILKIEAPIMELPDQQLLPLYRRLLELNTSTLFGASFGIDGSMVVITSEGLARNRDDEELSFMIDRVSRYADEYDDKLVAEFGGRRASDVGS